MPRRRLRPLTLPLAILAVVAALWVFSRAAILVIERTWPPLGPFPGLDSSYNTEWKGPWLGFDALLPDLTTLDAMTRRLERAEEGRREIDKAMLKGLRRIG